MKLSTRKYFSKILLRNFNHLQGFTPTYIMFGPFRAILSICNQRSLHHCTAQQARPSDIFPLKVQNTLQTRAEHKKNLSLFIHTKYYIHVEKSNEKCSTASLPTLNTGFIYLHDCEAQRRMYHSRIYFQVSHLYLYVQLWPLIKELS